MSEGFTCPNCGSPSVAYPEELDEDASVVCRTCRAPLGTIMQFRRLLESQPTRRGICTSGC